MQTSGEAVYIDSSALVKLVLQEPESGALREFLSARPVRISCALARVEVVRAVRPHGFDAINHAGGVLRSLRLVRLDDPLLDAAAGIGPGALRSLDAIHLAAALTVVARLGSLVTYDARMHVAAEDLGFHVAAPA